MDIKSAKASVEGGRISRSTASSNSALTHARAKAPAAKVRATYTGQEAKAKIDKAAKQAESQLERVRR